MYDEETLEFIREREEKLGNPLVWRSYATWFAEVGGERREFGVFMYSDGNTLVMEDFFRPAKVLGYEIGTKREQERKRQYRKMEIIFPVSSLSSISMVLKSKAEKALSDGNTEIPEAKGLGKLLLRTVVMVKAEGRTFFLEMADYKEFKDKFKK